jgi:dienelactone hydrolase
MPLVLAVLLQQDLVERALAENDREKRRALCAELRKHDFEAVKKCVRTRTYGAPTVALGEVVRRSSKTAHDGEAFEYALHVPKAYDPSKAWPLLVTLHGTNREGRADAGARWITAWLANAIVCERFIVVAPTTVRHTWSSRQGHSHVLTAIDEVARELHVDPDRVVLDGMSMGAGGTFDLAEYHPDRFAAIAPRCGAPDVRRKKDGSLVPMLCENFRHVPIHWVVGAKDEKIPIDIVRAAKDAIVAMKYACDYREHADGGHDWSLGKDDEIAAWLEKQRRPTYPDEVVWKSYEKGFPGAYWIEATKRTDATPILTTHLDMNARESETRAEFRPPVVIRARRAGNAIDVACEEVKELRVWLDDAMLDLDRPVTVTLNGKRLFDGKAKRSVDTLIDEARRRRDRAMTFSAFVDVKP